jgi:hypothetical protein
MKDTERIDNTMIRRTAVAIAAQTVAISMTACSHVTMMVHGTGAKRPAASRFGLGPRSSAEGRYTATLEPDKPLHPRQMHTVRVIVRDAEGRAIDGAHISVDGGMPQHGHGLPTRPRVTRSLGDGVYEIDGVRFNMGGWWEFRLAIEDARGTDTVTFNLDL